MKGKMSSSLISTAICLLATIYSVQSQCCDFVSSTCQWSSSQWKAAPSSTPNVASYSQFDSTKPSNDYLFIQDVSGTASSTNTFHVASSGVIFSFDYFLDTSESRATDTTLEVAFVSGSVTYTLGVLTAQSTAWQEIQISCQSLFSSCCPNNVYPCDGTITVSAFVDSTYPVGLFAVDNLGIGCSGVSTLTTGTGSTASPPPSPGTTCCDFNTNNCGASGTSWYWSKDKAPTIPIPEDSGDFDWSDAPGQLQFAESFGILEGATITFSYFINTPSSTLQLTFYPAASGPLSLATFSYVDTNWNGGSTTCTGCCGALGSKCDGTFVISTTGLSTNFEVAIDDFDVGDCSITTQGCCLFNAGDTCGYTYDNRLWLYRSVTPPPVTNPDSGTDYLYYLPGTLPSSAVLVAPALTYSSNTRFRGNIFVSTADTLNTLTVNFYNEDNAVTVTLGVIPDTQGLFRIFDYDCSVANCCSGAASCTGQIQIRVDTQSGASTDLYAVDAFEVFGSCQFFPGVPFNVHNSPRNQH